MTIPRLDSSVAITDADGLSPDELSRIMGGNGSLHGQYGVERTKQGRDQVNETGTYTVGRGDNLTNIANATNQSVADLIRQNPQYAKNPDLIHSGDRIVTGSSTHDA